MFTKANVLSAKGMLTAAKTIISVQKSTGQEIRTRLETVEKKLYDAEKEQSISEGMLRAAQAVEAGTAAALAAASARAAKAAAAEAAAIASANPVAISAATAVAAEATAREAKAIREHAKAVEHRKRLEERMRLARKCCEIAGSNLKLLRAALVGLEKVLSTTGAEGISRLRTAYEDIRQYNGELPPSASLGVFSAPAVPGQWDLPGMPLAGNAGGPLADSALTDHPPLGDTAPECSVSGEGDAQGQGTAKKKYYDDNGDLYRVGNDLESDTTYTVNGYTYTTDSLGRITSASGTLRVKQREGRMPIKDPIEDIGKGDEKSSDDRGHLIGDQFDGSNGLENMIPQDAVINQVVYRKFENQLASLVKEGKKITVLVEPSYSGGSHRPDGLWVTYTMDGGSEEVVFFPNSKEAAA